MKYAFIALLLVCQALMASAQKHHLFADAGVSFSRFKPGGSVTYNYDLVKFIGLGVGVQAHDFHATRTNQEYIPALYGEIRFNIRPRKNNQFFSTIDVGVDLYKHNTDYWHDASYVYQVQKDNGIYTGIGFGYFHKLKKHGWGPYTSLKLILNSYKTDAYRMTTNEHKVFGNSDGTAVFAVGFRF